jgi:hypothetical protein
MINLSTNRLGKIFQRFRDRFMVTLLAKNLYCFTQRYFSNPLSRNLSLRSYKIFKFLFLQGSGIQSFILLAIIADMAIVTDARKMLIQKSNENKLIFFQSKGHFYHFLPMSGSIITIKSSPLGRNAFFVKEYCSFQSNSGNNKS